MYDDLSKENKALNNLPYNMQPIEIPIGANGIFYRG
jgi:hypothetical protein